LSTATSLSRVASFSVYGTYLNLRLIWKTGRQVVSATLVPVGVPRDARGAPAKGAQRASRGGDRSDKRSWGRWGRTG
jgi:hypothetical protein